MGKRVLVIDDDEAILEVIQIVLEGEGYEVLLDSEGEFFDKPHKELPQLILLDILLAGKSGRDICLAIKKDEATKHIPVIIMSAHTIKEVEATAHSCGAEGVLPKPFDIEALTEMVKKKIGS